MAEKAPEPENTQQKEENQADPKPASSKSNTAKIIIFGSVIIVILLASVFVPRLIANNDQQANKYNGFDFSKEGDVWYTIVSKGNQPYSIPFYYHPKDLEDVVVDSAVRNMFFDIASKNGSIFITLDPDAGNNKVVIAGVEIAKITGNRYGLLNVQTKSAFSKVPLQITVNTQTPVLTCANATERRMIIHLIETGKNLVSARGNCVILEFKEYNESVRVADATMYHLLGIMS